MNRRQFIQRSAAAVAALGVPARIPCAHASVQDVFEHYIDEKTGAKIYRLTRDAGDNLIVYQTHPQWSLGQEYLLFMSKRDGKDMRPHVLSMATGEARPILAAPPQTFALSHHSNNLYYLHERTLCVVDLVDAFNGQEQGTEIAVLPDYATGLLGGISVDAEEAYVYVGVSFGADSQGLIACAPSTKAYHWIMRAPFKVGHVQANPLVSGRVMYCCETGGDAPQRVWTVDVHGMNHRPFFQESYGEWVTHEVWWGTDRAIFTVWPYDDERRAKPHGILRADYNTGAVSVLSQYDAWHTHGSPDLQWAMGDDFDRNIWLVRVADGERRLLTQGHKTEAVKPHPHASFTPDGKAILLNSGRFGTGDLLLAEIPAWDTLPLA
ncbi:MAG: twin-arginine translocation signal domain-containing protein [Candidatus Hydrogenedentes bacterium]|nr:twin-arginine translocation signal domain-containing protein [Candidatus Hydrogenedentota bacterium]